MFNKKDFGIKIKVARKSRGLSQENLGKAIGKNATTIGRYESGEIMPDAEQISLICDELGIAEYELFDTSSKILNKENMPYTMTSYSPCFRKEKGAHGIEERGVYRIHQFEKQEMIVVCEPEESYDWYEKMWNYTVELFRSMEIPVRTLECCSGDLADLKAKSVDVEAWSPRQQKYFEVGSCSILGDAQARRLGIRMKTEKGNEYVTTLNNTVLATPRGLIAVIENNYNEDGSINIPEALRPYMGMKDKIEIK